MAGENITTYKAYVEKLSEASGVHINDYSDLIDALQERHNFFAKAGCKLSDHGIEEFYAEDYTLTEIEQIFAKALSEKKLTREEILQFKSALMFESAMMDHAKGWTQQFHFGCIRNNNTRLFKQLGADTGFDSIGDFTLAKNMSKFLNRLDANNKLAKTILYNLNPRDNDLIATMIGNFQDGSVAGKIQFGSGWWFLDQKTGMEAQMNSLSSLGLLSRFVGMLTDSRSFLSYPRHEYFRRILCNLLGNDVENGELPASELPFIGQIVENVCFNNARDFFKF
jgi:glucuronate isomerase